MLQRYSLLLALVAAGACSDSTAPPSKNERALEVTIPRAVVSTSEKSHARFATLGTLDGGDQGPSVTITPLLVLTATQATLTATITWVGTTLSASAHLAVYSSDGKPYGTPVDVSGGKYQVIPTLGSTLTLTAQLALGVPCGLAGSGTVNADVKDEAFGVVAGDMKGGASVTDAQPPCVVKPTGGGTVQPVGSTGGTSTGGTTSGWYQSCSWVETGYQDAAGMHTVDTLVCKLVYLN